MSDKDTGALATDGKKLDSHKLNLTAEDFSKIDSDSNNQLSLVELTSAAKDGKFSGDKQTAVESLRDSLGNQKQGTDKDQQGIESWHTLDFAMNQISKDDFKSIDADKDNVLSAKELNAVEDNKDLNDMSKHAAQVLLKAQSAGESDQRLVVHRDTVMNWHDLDPELKEFQTSELQKLAEADPSKAVKAVTELVKRLDFQMTQAETIEGIKSIGLIQEALKANRDITADSKGNPILSDRPMTDERRWQMHAAVVGDMEVVNQQIQARQHAAQLLENEGKLQEAEKMRAEAIKKSDVLTEKVKTDDGQVRLVDLMKSEATQLTSDAAAQEDLGKRADMIRASEVLKEMTRNPIETRLQDARANLGLHYVKNADNSIGIRVDTTSKGFNVDRAEQRSKEAKDLSIDILGVDPTTTKDNKHSSIFGSSWAEIDPKAKFNFYRDANKNGKVDILERVREMKKYNDSWKGAFGYETELK